MTFSESGPVPAQGGIAQQIFWYTAFTADMTTKGLPVCKRRWHSEMAHGTISCGPYWEEGMKKGYQDVWRLDLHELNPRRSSSSGMDVRSSSQHLKQSL